MNRYVACNISGHITEGRSETERALPLAPEPAGAVRAAAVVLYVGGGLRRHDPLLELPEKILGLVEREPDLFKRVVRLVQHQHLHVTGFVLSGIDPQPDLDPHVAPPSSVFQNAQRGKPALCQPPARVDSAPRMR